MTNLSGHWLGTYWQQNQATRFELDLMEIDGILTGTIIDLGPLGRATLAGDRYGTAVRFDKRYLNADNAIIYRGVLDTEAIRMAGEWQFPAYAQFSDLARGQWRAYRSSTSARTEQTTESENSQPA